MERAFALAALFLCGLALAQAPAPDVAWPREVKAADGTVITVYQPQVERWQDNRLSGRAAVSVKPQGAPEPHYGVIEVSELYRALRSIVARETQGQQTPWLARQDLIGDFAVF